MKYLKSEIQQALALKPYNCRKTINALKTVERISEAYKLPNSKKRSYSLEEHTIMVCELFESLFARNYVCAGFDISCFRLLLCLHDVGKPFSIQQSEKERQGEYTVKIINEFVNCLPLSKAELDIVRALISDDPLGLCIRGKIGCDESIDRIIAMKNRTSLRMAPFLHLLIIYYQVDAGAYSRYAYIGPADNFSEKPKLEAAFQKDSKGCFIYLYNERRLLFSQDAEEKLQRIRKGLGIING